MPDPLGPALNKNSCFLRKDSSLQNLLPVCDSKQVLRNDYFPANKEIPPTLMSAVLIDLILLMTFSNISIKTKAFKHTVRSQWFLQSKTLFYTLQQKSGD